MRIGALVIAVGVGLSFIASVVPHFSGAYELRFGVLLTQLTPYLIYAPAAFRLPDRAVTIAGTLLVLVHAGLVAMERFAGGGAYEGPAIYAVPLLMALLLLPLLVRTARQPWPAP